MTTLVRIAITLLLALLVSSCISFGEGKRGNGVIAEETRKVTENFTEYQPQKDLMFL